MREPLKVEIVEKSDNPVILTLNIISKIITTVYVGIVAWETMKMMLPQLEVQEKILIERISRSLPKSAKTKNKLEEEKLQQEIINFISDVENYVRVYL